jgi:hypothetical protein
VAPLCQLLLLVGSQEDNFFVRGDRWNYSHETYLATDSESVQGLDELLRGSRLLKSLFLPRGIENGQLLQYGHAYQLSGRVNVKMMDARTSAMEQCENRNAITSKRSYNQTER